MTDNDGKTPAERLEAALADMEAQKAAAAEFRDEHKAEFAAEIARLNAAHAKLAAMPQHERRQVLNAAGMKHVLSAPTPITPLRGGSFVRTTPSQQAPEPINWKLWLNMPQVALWEAVALLLNIDPRSLKHSPQGWMAGPGTGPHFEPGSFRSTVKLNTFDDAMLLGARAANYAGPIHLRTGLAVGMNKRTALVALPEVVAFFVGCDWPDIPAPLLARVPAIAEPAPAVVALAPASAPTANETPVDRDDRRYREFKTAGGDYIEEGGKWHATGPRGELAKLCKREKTAGRPMSDDKDVRESLKHAAKRSKSTEATGRKGNSVFNP